MKIQISYRIVIVVHFEKSPKKSISQELIFDEKIDQFLLQMCQKTRRYDGGYDFIKIISF